MIDSTSPLIFDFGGVLVDWDPRYLYRKLSPSDAEIERFLQEVDFHGWNQRQDAGRPFAAGVAELSARFPHYAAWISAYDQRYEESIRGPIDGTVALMDRLRRRGHPLYGLSNWSMEKFTLVRHKYPFFAWLDEVVISGDVKLIKPDPRIFALLLEKVGRPAGDCLLIDDSPGNVAAACRLGFHALRFRSPAGLEADLTALGLL